MSLKKSYKKPDLNAPRYRPNSMGVITPEFYKKFKEQHPQYKNTSNSTIKQIVELFHYIIYREVIDNRNGVELLEQLGSIFIGSCPRKKWDNPDREKSIQLEKRVQYQNWESDNYLAKIFYTNYESKYKFKFHELWGFKPHRNFTRAAGGDNYRKNWKKYVQVNSYIKVSRLIRKTNKLDKKEVEKIDLLKDYDEFS